MLEAVENPLSVRVELLAPGPTLRKLGLFRQPCCWASALVALVWANTPWGETYGRLLGDRARPWLGENPFALSLREWVDDGLMSSSFFVVGLGIKREVTMGELVELRRAALPIAGAIGGMLASALMYLALNADGPLSAAIL